MPESLEQLQQQFTRHLRDPQHHPAPAEIEDRRMQIYRDLLFNNIKNFITNGFPVLHSITADTAWESMVRDFFAHHKSHTPLFPQLTKEFLHYLEHERETQSEDYPFMRELAYYEWVETKVMLDDQVIPRDQYDPDGDLLAGIPVLNPGAVLLVSQWPVHQISPNFLPDEPLQQPVCLLVYRRLDYQHKFMELNPLTARLFECLHEGVASGKEALLQIAQGLPANNVDSVVQGGHDILQELLAREVILGTAIP